MFPHVLIFFGPHSQLAINKLFYFLFFNSNVVLQITSVCSNFGQDLHLCLESKRSVDSDLFALLAGIVDGQN